jgi:hypothetical protein
VFDAFCRTLKQLTQDVLKAEIAALRAEIAALRGAAPAKPEGE